MRYRINNRNYWTAAIEKIIVDVLRIYPCNILKSARYSRFIFYLFSFYLLSALLKNQMISEFPTSVSWVQQVFRQSAERLRSECIFSKFGLCAASLPPKAERFRGGLHSVRNDFTGFATAAFIDWKLTVINAIRTATKPADKNTHHLIFIL